ncbi:MAG: SDR family NAD(P)-dependent oxidoreductase [Bacteroidota bacterium]
MKNKNAVVTGGSRGIGLALAKSLVESGVKVLSLDKVDPPKKISNNSLFTHIHCDLENFEQLKKCIKVLKSKIESIDYLINNAAIQYVASLNDYTERMWDEVLDVNLKAPFFLIKMLLEKMGGDTRIINVSSVHGAHPRPNKYSYDISKAGLNMLTKELAIELAPYGIKINTVAVGATRTPMNNMFQDEDLLKAAEEKIPLGRVSEAEEVARFIKIILDKNNAYLTGSIIYFDGGRSLQ